MRWVPPRLSISGKASAWSLANSATIRGGEPGHLGAVGAVAALVAAGIRGRAANLLVAACTVFLLCQAGIAGPACLVGAASARRWIGWWGGSGRVRALC